MAIRRRAVLPDTVYPTRTYGEIPCVSDERFYAAVMEAAGLVALAGGVMQVIVERHPTDLEHERITTRAVVEWKDRTDARPQAEPAAPALPAPVETPRVAAGGLELQHAGDALVAATEAGLQEARAAHVEEDSLDGFKYEELDEEDLSSIPEHAR